MVNLVPKINNLLTDRGIHVYELRENSYACDKYVYTCFEQEDNSRIMTMVPYVYCQSGLFLETAEEVANHLIGLKKYFSKSYINKWCMVNSKAIVNDPSVTAFFFRILLGARCKEITQEKFPQNYNTEKIFQKIKNRGYVISILRDSKDDSNRKNRYWLLPIPMTVGTIYETMSDEFKKHAISVLGDVDAFEGKKSPDLLLDHKFSVIRWDEGTPEENPADMPAKKVIEKFQMLTAQRHQQKLDVCRHCYKTGERGTLLGIMFYYQGNERWDPNIPKRGIKAKQGCIGCPWYDIKLWKKKLQEKNT